MKNALELQNVSKSFKGFEMKDMTFSLPEGCILGLVGKNGAGKSTTIRLIMDMIHKDSGTIYVLGKNIEEDFTETKQDIGVVLDEPSFPEYVTADQMNNIMKNIYRNWDEKRYYELIDQFELPKWKKQFKNYSKGMKMKLSIICAMAHRPKLLILDEATTGLDPVVRDEVLDLFLEFIQDEDCSIFFSSHITSDIQKIADYVILIHQGKIIFEEQKDNLVYNYGVAKCGKEKFAQLSADDYIIHRTTNMSVECLVHDKEAFKRKYKNIIVDNATLEDIMLFYVKGGTSCED